MGRYNFNQKTQDGYEISPEQAKKWLEKNDNNRNINYAKVKKMAKDMKEGHWDTTHQGIAIASDGTLVDGQHRLLAIVESGVTVRMNVTFNASKSQHIDSGNSRSMANRVQMSDYDMSWTNKTILSAANLIGRLFAGSNLSHEEALSEWLMRYRTQIESTSKCIKKATLPGLNSAGTTAAIIVAAINDVPLSTLRNSWTCSILDSPTMKPSIMLSRCGTNCCVKIVSNAAHSMQSLPSTVQLTG